MQEGGDAVLVGHINDLLVPGEDELAQVVRADQGLGLESEVVGAPERGDVVALNDSLKRLVLKLADACEDVAHEVAILDELDAQVLVAQEERGVLVYAARGADDFHRVGKMTVGVFEGGELLVGDARPVERVEIVAVANDAVDADDPIAILLGESRGVFRLPLC